MIIPLHFVGMPPLHVCVCYPISEVVLSLCRHPDNANGSHAANYLPSPWQCHNYLEKPLMTISVNTK